MLYVHPKNSNHLRAHSRTIMALDHSRLGLENKSARIFLLSTSLLYKILPTNLGVCKPTFYIFIPESAPLIERVRLRQLRFLGSCWSCAPLAWKWACQRFCNVCSCMKPGRQRTLFTNYIHCLLGDPDNLLNNNELLEMAQDRHQWSKLVGDCSAAEWWWCWWSRSSQSIKIDSNQVIFIDW